MRPDPSRVRLSQASYFATILPVPSCKIEPSNIVNRFDRYRRSIGSNSFLSGHAVIIGLGTAVACQEHKSGLNRYWNLRS